MSSKKSQPQSQPPKQQQNVQAHAARVQTQSKIVKPDKNVIVPKYVCFVNERQEGE